LSIQKKQNRQTIEWEDTPVFNQTVVGDSSWTDYAMSREIFFSESYSYATILCRATEMHQSHKLPEAYLLKLQSLGKWELIADSKNWHQD
jgi:hypothetical protein